MINKKHDLRIQIRRGVFETNSSSTHSLQLTKKDRDSINKFIVKDIEESYGGDEYNADTFYDDGVVILRGLYIPDGDENSNVYVSVSSWEGKIQFLAMQIFKEFCYSHYEYDSPSVNRLWENSDVAKEFMKCVKECYESKGYSVESVEVDISEDGVWFDDDVNLGSRSKEFRKVNSDTFECKTAEDVRKLFDKIVYGDESFLFMDKAYSPYEKPTIIHY